jgi:FAD/FMN-containing dehydrogenase
MTKLLSWGRYPRYPQHAHAVNSPDEVASALSTIANLKQGAALAFGCGRSYGDSCLAESNHVLETTGMNRLLSADWETGVITAEAGLTLSELTQISLPQGWFLAVTPGTEFVTLGGAVANDVHGKNHHINGTFGCHISHLSLYRSDEGLVECSATQRPELFAATIGGLGLTGIILTVTLQLRRVTSNEVDQLCIRFANLDEFFELSKIHDTQYEYTVAWIDCLAKGNQVGRGHFMCGNHAKTGELKPATPLNLSMPVELPFSLVNALSLRVFNTLYYHRQLRREASSRINYHPFFYPLDGIKRWNRLYGRAGFQQYQCVIPEQHGKEVISEIMRTIANSGTGSFLAVLKQCGNIPSPGLLSFPLHGVSLALDFPHRESLKANLFDKLDNRVHEAGGRLYPAKDAHISATHFRQAYPDWEKIEALRDRQLLSKFWQRVTQ